MNLCVYVSVYVGLCVLRSWLGSVFSDVFRDCSLQLGLKGYSSDLDVAGRHVMHTSLFEAHWGF